MFDTDRPCAEACYVGFHTYTLSILEVQNINDFTYLMFSMCEVTFEVGVTICLCMHNCVCGGRGGHKAEIEKRERWKGMLILLIVHMYIKHVRRKVYLCT